jgi:ribonuclease-3
MDTRTLCRKIGYNFRQGELLRRALTHRSYGVPHNERLEFLGDSVLNCVIATRLYDLHSRVPEGDLSRMRAHLVREETLSEIALSLDLGDYLYLGEGELKSGGFRRPSILADTLEAVLGAVYLDGGFAAAERVIGELYAPLLKDLDPKTLGKDPKTLLQEYLQGRKIALPQYVVVTVTGEAHRQHFQVECLIPALGIRSLGEGQSRRAAEQDAARKAYQMIAHA